jgi:hypothetical protein
MDYFDDLIEEIGEAKTTTHIDVEQLEKKDINTEDDLKFLNEYNQAIYVIKQKDGDVKQTRKDFKAARKTQRRKDGSKTKKGKVRKKSWPKLVNDPSKIMYVGSSTDNRLHTRIKNHTLKCSDGTSGLRLNDWFHNDYEITIYIYDTSLGRLRLIEDAMWYDLKPAFGKREGYEIY